jgi:tRNA dimethylallyltransferase
MAAIESRRIGQTVLTRKMSKTKVLLILGPTASGKTDLAMQVADQVDARLISVDSALIYRDMNIGTAKPSELELRQYPHDLVDIIDPTESFSVAQFIDRAKDSIEQAVSENKLPVLVGGTMLYFKGLIEGLSDVPEADLAERAKIEAEAKEQGWPAMHAQLAELDPDSAARIDPNHSHRIGRALEVCRSSGLTMTELLDRPSSRGYRPLTENYDLYQIGLNPSDRADLHKRIDARFEQMLQAGFIEEVEELKAKYPLTAEHASMRCVGYRQAWQYLEQDFDKLELVERGQAATRQLAKRQLTWMRKWPDLNLLSVDYNQEKSRTNAELTQATLNCLNSELC